MAKRKRHRRHLGSAAYRSGWDATFGPKKSSKKQCKHGKVKSGARKGMCRLHAKRRRK